MQSEQRSKFVYTELVFLPYYVTLVLFSWKKEAIFLLLY